MSRRPSRCGCVNSRFVECCRIKHETDMFGTATDLRHPDKRVILCTMYTDTGMDTTCTTRYHQTAVSYHHDPSQHKKTRNKVDSQRVRRLTQEGISTRHFPRPHIPQEPPYMAHSTPNQVPSSRFPRTADHPRKCNESERKIRC